MRRKKGLKSTAEIIFTQKFVYIMKIPNRKNCDPGPELETRMGLKYNIEIH